MFMSILTLYSFSPLFTHWNMLSPALVTAGCNRNRMTIILTTMFLFMSSIYFFNGIQTINHMMIYKIIRNSGSSAIRNVLNIVAFGANPFISLSCMNQSSDTNDSEANPTIWTGENISEKLCG